MPSDLLKYKKIFKRYANLKLMDVETLRKIAHFMSLEPITGFNIINNLLGVLTFKKLKVPLDAPGINIVTHFFLVRELKLYFAKLRKEDESLSFAKLDNFTEEEIDLICF